MKDKTVVIIIGLSVAAAMFIVDTIVSLQALIWMFSK